MVGKSMVLETASKFHLMKSWHWLANELWPAARENWNLIGQKIMKKGKPIVDRKKKLSLKASNWPTSHLGNGIQNNGKDGQN